MSPVTVGLESCQKNLLEIAAGEDDLSFDRPRFRDISGNKISGERTRYAGENWEKRARLTFILLFSMFSLKKSLLATVYDYDSVVIRCLLDIYVEMHVHCTI